jgi:hypothetical protein
MTFITSKYHKNNSFIDILSLPLYFGILRKQAHKGRGSALKHKNLIAT